MAKKKKKKRTVKRSIESGSLQANETVQYTGRGFNEEREDQGEI